MPRYFDPAEYSSDMEAVADGLFAIAAAIKALGDEAIGAVIADKLERVADEVGDGLSSISNSISEGVQHD
jgi:hypothetical protein